MMFSFLYAPMLSGTASGRNGAALPNVGPYVNTSSVKKDKKRQSGNGLLFRWESRREMAKYEQSTEYAELGWEVIRVDWAVVPNG